MTAAHASTKTRNILLTGRPGIGKTTIIIRLTELLEDWEVTGFYTEEVRSAGRRVGFGVTTFSGETAVLAHERRKSLPRVSRYGVDVAAFERLVLPELERSAKLLLVDEIGKMECLSVAFTSAVRDLLDASIPVVATVAVAGSGFIAEVKARSDVEIMHVTGDNRDDLPQRLARLLCSGMAGG